MQKLFEDVDWQSDILDPVKIHYDRISPNLKLRYYKSYPHPPTTKKILFIHGFGLFMDSYAPFINALNRSFNIIAIDTPGHGFSSELSNYDLDSTLHAIQSFISHQNLSNFELVGHSLGGYIASCLRTLYPSNSLVAITPAGIGVVSSPLIKLAKNKFLNQILRGFWKGTFKAILSKASQLLEFQLPEQKKYDDIWYTKHVDKHRKYVNSQLMYLRDFDFEGGEDIYRQLKGGRNLFILCVDDTYVKSDQIERFVVENELGEVRWYDAIHQVTQAIPRELSDVIVQFLGE